MNAQELIRQVLLLFPASHRPAHFTNHEHCEECRDHDITLRAHNRDQIGFDVLGNPAWDPICFVNEAGYKHYFPALVRLALNGTGNDYYIDQFLFHINQNEHSESLSKEQSALVLKILEHLLAHKSEEIEFNLDADDLLNAIERWRK